MIGSVCCLLLLVNFPSGLLAESMCYGELGCLELNDDWYDLLIRPVNLFPLAREIIDTEFILYTRNNTGKGQTLSAQQNDSIVNSNFNSTKQTKLIVHGFIDTTIFSSWIEKMRLELLKREDVNVIEVDWDNGAVPPYTQATANTRLVGLEIAFLINHLKDTAWDHTAGYAGEKIPGLGRITALDPAGPYFQGMGTHVRLDPTDATFVDVIHTDGTTLGYGMSDPCGHLDFYPNNGKEQPGCDVISTFLPINLIINLDVENAMRDSVACNHGRSISLFIESINSQCIFIGHRCSDYQSFLTGLCPSTSANGSQCAVMGYGAKNVDGPPLAKYFLRTNGAAPYCRKPGRAERRCSPPQS